MGVTIPAHAQFYEFSFPGTSSFDGWENMNAVNFQGFGSFPGTSAWPQAAAANAPGSGDAGLMKLSGAAFFASSSLYFGSLQQVSNALGATLRVSDATPVAGLRTVAFQIQIGEVMGYDFHLPSGVPVLKLNGSSEGLPASLAVVLNQYQNGTFESPDTGEEPIYVNTWAFEWHLPEGGPVTSLAIEFGGVTHAQIYAMRLDQSATPTGPLFVPELFVMGSQIGTPAFDGEKTSVAYTFRATPTALLNVEYRESLSSGAWISSGPHAAENDGNLNVTLTSDGDHRAAWSNRMFFRAGHPTSPRNP